MENTPTENTGGSLHLANALRTGSVLIKKAEDTEWTSVVLTLASDGFLSFYPILASKEANTEPLFQEDLLALVVDTDPSLPTYKQFSFQITRCFFTYTLTIFRNSDEKIELRLFIAVDSLIKKLEWLAELTKFQQKSLNHSSKSKLPNFERHHQTVGTKTIH